MQMAPGLAMPMPVPAPPVSAVDAIAVTTPEPSSAVPLSPVWIATDTRRLIWLLIAPPWKRGRCYPAPLDQPSRVATCCDFQTLWP